MRTTPRLAGLLVLALAAFAAPGLAGSASAAVPATTTVTHGHTAGWWVHDEASQTTASLVVTRSASGTTAAFHWTQSNCVDDGTHTTCTYESRDYSGPATPKISFLAKLGGATLTKLTVNYAVTRWSIVRPDAGGGSVRTDLAGGNGRTTVTGTLTGTGPTGVSSYSPAPGVSDTDKTRAATPSITLFGAVFGPATNDGSQIIASTVTTTT